MRSPEAIAHLISEHGMTSEAALDVATIAYTRGACPVTTNPQLVLVHDSSGGFFFRESGNGFGL